MGGFSHSPDLRLTLVYGTIVDHTASSRRGGYAALEGNRLLVSGTAERPQEAAPPHERLGHIL